MSSGMPSALPIRSAEPLRRKPRVILFNATPESQQPVGMSADDNACPIVAYTYGWSEPESETKKALVDFMAVMKRLMRMRPRSAWKVETRSS